MKQLIFIFLVLISFSVKAQDTTLVTLTDSSKGYAYKDVYVVVDNIMILPKGTKNTPFTDTTGLGRLKFETYLNVTTYSSRADYLSGKANLFSKGLKPLFTDNFPTAIQIRNHLKNNLQ